MVSTAACVWSCLEINVGDIVLHCYVRPSNIFFVSLSVCQIIPRMLSHYSVKLLFLSRHMSVNVFYFCNNLFPITQTPCVRHQQLFFGLDICRFLLNYVFVAVSKFAFLQSTVLIYYVWSVVPIIDESNICFLYTLFCFCYLQWKKILLIMF